MLTSKRLGLLLFTGIVIASVACSNKPTQVESTLSIEALVEANKVIDALVEAKVKEVVAALPTSTPYPTYTLVPTPNPIPTPTVILPTPTVILPTPTMPPTMTPVPLSMATRTSVPPPTVTPLPTVISKGTLPVFPWATAIPEPDTGPNINEEWIDNLESLIHTAINRERRKHNLPNLEYDSALADIARLHSQDMIESGYFEHTNMEGESPGDRAKKAGYICQNKRIGDLVYTGLSQEIASSSLWKDLSLEDGDLIYDYYSPSELASEIVSGEENGWTAGDREALIIMKPDIHLTQGVGVAHNKFSKSVYVTLNMSVCDFRWRLQK